VPLDVDGVTRGKPTDKVGQRPLNQGEIFFDDVAIPMDHMVAGPDQYNAMLEATLTGANGGMGSLFCGLARAALEHSVDYAKERMKQILQTHKPIPLNDEQEREIQKILDRARKYYEEKGLI